MTTQDNLDDSAAPLIEHLTELRTRLIRSLIAFVIAMVICFAFWNPVFNFLTQPLCRALAERGQEECGLVLIALQEGFFVAVSISMLGGLVFSFPVISYQMWRFVAPGLYRQEKQAFLPFLIASPVMFFLGASFAYFVITPMAFDFFLGFQQGSVMEDTDGNTQAAGILFQGSAQAYLKLTIKFIIAFGLCFQLPVLLTLMGKAGLVGADGLRATRKYAVVGILVLAALATPPDVVSQVMLFVVVYGLYEVSIQLVSRVERQREEQLRAEGYYDDEGAEADFEDEPESETKSADNA